MNAPIDLEECRIDYHFKAYNPDNNIVKIVAFENHLKQHHPEVKIDHKKRVIWDIVKKVGGSINPRWRYKY